MLLQLGPFDVTQRNYAQAQCNDTDSRYFAQKLVDCDYGHVTLRLTSDRRLQYEGSGATLERRRLGTILKNRVHLFDSPVSVRRIAGKPFKQATRGANDEYLCFMYKSIHMDNATDGDVLRNTYIFKKNRLIEVAVSLDSIPGCGEDSLSDEGWPWSQF